EFADLNRRSGFHAEFDLIAVGGKFVPVCDIDVVNQTDVAVAILRGQRDRVDSIQHQAWWQVHTQTALVLPAEAYVADRATVEGDGDVVGYSGANALQHHFKTRCGLIR